MLPTEIFACGAAPKAADNTYHNLATRDNHDMCYVQDKPGCGATVGCVWCQSNKAPSGCYFEDKARRWGKCNVAVCLPADCLPLPCSILLHP